MVQNLLPATPNPAESLRFLRLLYGTADHGWLTLWTLQDKKSHWINLELERENWEEDAAALLETLGGEFDTYAGVSLRPQNLGPHARGKATDSIGIPGVWLDLDVADPLAHHKPNLPPTHAAALALLTEIELPPTVVVSSGHGLQAYWLFREFWYFETHQDYSDAAVLVQSWQAMIRRRAADHGWDVDATHDMARVMRLPGTLNRKTDPPVAAITLSAPPNATALAYASLNPSDLMEHVARLPDSAFLGGMGAPETSSTVARMPNSEAIRFQGVSVPFQRFTALLENSSRFRQTWERKRRDLTDQSASGYDLALANALVAADWTDAEIAATMLAWRQKENEDPEKLTRQKYLTDTIAKARVSRSQEQRAGIEAAEALKTIVAAQEQANVASNGHRSGAAETLNDARTVGLAKASELLGYPVEAVYRVLSTPTSYAVVLGGHEFALGSAVQALEQKALQAAMFNAAMPPFQRLKGPRWAEVVGLFATCAVDRRTGTLPGEIAEAWIQGYLKYRPAVDSREEAMKSQGPFAEGGKLYIFFDSFFRWLSGQPDKPSQKDAATALRALGGVVTTVRRERGSGDGRVRVWRLASPADADESDEI